MVMKLGPRRNGFTLIEILVVIGIISVLAGLLFPAIRLVQFRSKVTLTGQRLQNVTTALATYAMQEGSVTQSLQEGLLLGGPIRFASFESIIPVIEKGGGGRSWPPPIVGEKNGNPYPLQRNDVLNPSDSEEHGAYIAARRLFPQVFDVLPPATGAVAASWYEDVWPAVWPMADWDQLTPGDNPPILRFPWGRPPLAVGLAAGDPATSTRLTSVYVNRSNGDTVVYDPLLPLPFDAGQMSPLKSMEFLQAVEILARTDAGRESYRADRGPGRAWNDAWGNPLIIAYALFIPERRRAANDQNQRSRLLQESKNTYGVERSLYLIGGAVGPVRDPTEVGSVWTDAPAPWPASDDARVLRGLWRQIRTVADAHEWTEEGWSAAPWSGVKVGRDGSQRCIITEPVQLP